MERRLAAILSYDVVGYSRAMSVDERGTLEWVKSRRREAIDPKATQYGGRTIKLMGDGALMEFASVVDAVAFAVSVQQTIADLNADETEDQRLLYRIGINVGDVIADGDDIYGDGVNVAVRLEGLAEPGGICIRRNVRNQVRGKLDLDFKDLGEVEVKNIDRPVRAFHVVMNEKAQALAAAPADRPPQPKSYLVRWQAVAALALVLIAGGSWLYFQPTYSELSEGAVPIPGESASIVVLPLDNLSDDPAQGYLADGLTEDITTDLSQLSDLFVIARNSAFTYKDQTVDPKQVSRELGVRYVIEGSVRRVGDLLRINIQLVDGQTGGHLWAERYDGSLDDLLAFQDTVIERVVSSLPLHLDSQNRQQAREADTDDPKAFDAYLQGWEHYIRRTPEDFAAAITHFKRAVEIDPNYGRAYAALASTYWEGWERLWHEPLGFDAWPGPRREAERYLEIALRTPTALAHQVASEVRRQEDRFEEMIREARTAVELNPNDPNSYIALALGLPLYGNPQEALIAVDRAMKLDPHYQPFYLFLKGFTYFSLRRYGEAAQFLEQALERNPANFPPNIILIATYAHLGNIGKAKERLDKHPLPLSIDWVAYYWRFKNAKDWNHLADGLRLAGTPEVATEFPTPTELEEMGQAN